MVPGFFGDVPKSAYERGERNIMGELEPPGPAIRSAIQGKGYQAGMVNPDVPRFQDLALNKYYKSTDPTIESVERKLPVAGNLLRGARDLVGFGVSGAGMAADVITDPVQSLGLIAGKTPVGPKLSWPRTISSGRTRKSLEELASESRAGKAFGRFITKERKLQEARVPFSKTPSQKADKLSSEATRIYRDILRPTQGEVNKVEVRLGKNI